MEALLVLVVLTLGSAIVPHKGEGPGLTVVRLKAAADQPKATPNTSKHKAPAIRRTEHSSAEAAQPDEVAAPLPQPRPREALPQLIRLSPSEMAAADIAAIPRQPGAPISASGPKMGPPDTGMPNRDTPRVSGTGPDGEPLYAASWYREPYDDELRGYLSTATGPGWGLIACRTAPDYRVEDCVKVDEHPTGSNIARSVLAAAWQFRVRPPRIGGEPKIGEWVRIRIDYEFVAKSRR